MTWLAGTLRRGVGRLLGRGPSPRARRAFERELARVAPVARERGWSVLRYALFDAGEHPEGYTDYECRFAAWHLRAAAARRVLDVGSYRHFVLGLSAGCQVTALDVRPRASGLATETVVTGDARRLDLPDASFDAVVTLSSVEHFGLGRYGDEVDLAADSAAAAEMRRVLRPGGMLVVTTTLTRGAPVLAFNAHRIYDRAAARALGGDLKLADERFFSRPLGRECAFAEVSDAPGEWDVYCGCWVKEDGGG